MSQEREGAGEYFAYLLRLWREKGSDQVTRCVAMPGQSALLQGSTHRIPSRR